MEQNPSEERTQYRYRLLRCVPNQISEEFYNVAVVVYDTNDRVVDARFTPDFRRMRCNPAVKIEELEQIRDEFEERRLLGEDFSGYLEALIRDASNSIQISGVKVDHWTDPAKEIERLVAKNLATPVALEEEREEGERPAGGRRAVHIRMTDAFARHGLFRNGHGMQRDVSVEYGGAGLKFVFDFEYRRPSSERRFVQALGLRSADAAAARLCFVMQEYRGRSDGETGLTVVSEDALGEDVRDLLARQGVGTVDVSRIDGYAESIRAELGL